MFDGGRNDAMERLVQVGQVRSGMGHDNGSDDEAIASGLCQHDPRMLEAIIARYSRELFYFMRMILGQVGTIQDVEECVNDLFVSVWQECDAFDARRGSFRTWLTMRAKYLALDRRRQLLRRHATTVALSSFDMDGDLNEVASGGNEHVDRLRQPEDWVSDSLDTVLEQREEQEYLRTALARLPELDRQLIYLRYFRLATTEEMATRTGLSKHAIDTRLWRTRKLLKEALREPLHGRI